jgi:hypothetical protein
MKKNKEEVERLKRDTIRIKTELIDIMRKIESEGGIKEAEQLGKVIGRLEIWQNR